MFINYCIGQGYIVPEDYFMMKGYQRRVAFAQAIIHDPDILIMDEPTDGLDPNQREDVQSLILEMAKTKAIILSTHLLREVELLCPQLLILNQGCGVGG